MPGGGDVLLGPGALPAQRNRVRSHPIARPDSRYPVADRGDVPGRLDAQRHRGTDPQIPVPGAGELIPVAHAGCLHAEQHLIRGQRPGIAHLDHLNRGIPLTNPSSLHLPPPRSACRARTAAASHRER